jgi:hypothetical protein
MEMFAFLDVAPNSVQTAQNEIAVTYCQVFTDTGLSQSGGFLAGNVCSPGATL